MKRKKYPIVGRQDEQRLLNRLLKSSKAEFLAVYGRRRVGKTFLIRQYFCDKGIFFEVTGAIDSSTTTQLQNFHVEFTALVLDTDHHTPPSSWNEAFQRLVSTIHSLNTQKKIILFFDELPWLSSAKSGFLSALDYAWNRHLSNMSNILLIVSGSAASWMINNVINNTGGLYGRLSAHLRLIPFTLAETKQYLLSRQIDLPHKQICELYMVTGGIPKYLSYIEPSMSATQNVHYLCFMPQSPLITEFHKLYYSLFQKAETHLLIIRTLAEYRHGLIRSELLRKTRLPNSGRTTEVIRELEESGFILTLTPIGKKTRDTCYYLNDEYSLFYLHWIENHKSTLLQGVDNDYWLKRQAQPSWKSWAGFAFESLCFKHIRELKNAMRIGGVTTIAGYWKAIENGKKVGEIDLVIDRADQCINLCEIKFCEGPFKMTKAYANELIRKKNLFRSQTKTKKALFTTLITPYGATENPAYLSAVDLQITLDELF